jgi:TBC1 domain family protein 5
MIDPHETRTRYNSLCLTLPTRPDTDAEDDPLSVISAAAGEESPWGKYFKDMELCKVIQLDLDRTYPEIEFFADQQTKKKMLNILFIWAKKNSDIAYRQGLNELLSPIMLVVADGKKIKATEDDGLTDVEKAWLDPDFEEHDAYAIFELVMIRMKKFFSLKNDLKANSASKSLAAQDPLYKEEKINYVVARSDFIQRVLLKKIEPSLAFHLNKLGLEPQIYGLYFINFYIAG